jgi:hypothetical protein
VKVCVVIYRFFMYAPFFSCGKHQFCSPYLATLVQAWPLFTDAATSKMCSFNSSVSLSKGDTCTKSLMCPHRKKLHGVRSGELEGGGGTLSEESLLVQLDSTSPALWQMLI